MVCITNTSKCIAGPHRSRCTTPLTRRDFTLVVNTRVISYTELICIGFQIKAIAGHAREHGLHNILFSE